MAPSGLATSTVRTTHSYHRCKDRMAQLLLRIPYALIRHACMRAVDSTRLFTASADQTVRMWELQTGKELFQFRQQEPCRAVSLSVGEGMLAFTTDAFMGTQSMIHIAKLEQDIEQQSSKSVLSIEAPKGRITRVFWSELNRVLVTSHDGGFLRKWDSEVCSGCRFKVSITIRLEQFPPRVTCIDREDAARGEGARGRNPGPAAFPRWLVRGLGLSRQDSKARGHRDLPGFEDLSNRKAGAISRRLTDF